MDELRLTTFLERRMRGDLMETFKIIMEFLIMVDIFLIFFLKLEIYCLGCFQKLLTNRMFFVNKVIYFWNKLSNQIKNSNCVEHFKSELNA